MAEPGYYFVSYSSVDAKATVRQLADRLEGEPPNIPIWLDQRKLRPGDDWDEQIVEAIKTCRGVLFAMTLDSVKPNSVCKHEWVWALRYKKPVIPLRFDRDAELPFRLGSRQSIDFTGSLDAALARLRSHLEWMDSPAGALQALKERLADAERELPRADPEQQPRIEQEIEELRRQITEQEHALADPQVATKRTEDRIASGLERERQPEKRPTASRRAKFINPPPMHAPTWFQDRHVETRLIGDYLRDESLRLLTVVGRGGVGKTAMVCRLLKALEGGQLPDDLGPLAVDGIVYLSKSGGRAIGFPNLFADLCRLLSDDTAQVLGQRYRDPQQTPEDLMRAVLERFPTGRTIVLLDNFEDVVDPQTFAITDQALDQALRTVLTAPQHGLRVILTTRIAPQKLLVAQPALQRRLNLDEGLESPHAEEILKAMDPDGTLGLKTAPDALLTTARERTRGYPRALEALVGILAADRNTSLPELLAETAGLPGDVVEELVGEAFNRLDPLAQHVMQALAVYAVPVPPVAVDYLLQPFHPAIDSALVLGRLVNMQFVRRDAGRYYLHQVDRDYALSRVPEGQSGDRDTAEPPFTRYGLRHRGAEYFAQTRKPRAAWKQLEDLAPQLAEFELRCQGEDYDTAAAELLEVDFDYLLLWGHYRPMVELHERLQGKLTDPALELRSTANLGNALFQMGAHRRAIDCYEQALAIAQELDDRQGEARHLGNLATCYASLGEVRRAVEAYEQALVIAQELGDRQGEATLLGNLGNCYASLGEVQRAVETHEQALAMARGLGDRQGEARHLANLGNCYASLGEVQRAVGAYEQVLAIVRGLGFRQGEAIALINLGACDATRDHWESAIQRYHQAIRIADETGLVQIQSEARSGLAQARLFQGELAAARQAAAAARAFDYPTNNANVSATLGVILLRLGDREPARVAFAEAVAQADGLLAHTGDNYALLDTKTLALGGLVLLGDAARLPEAVAAVRAARAVNQAAGVVRDAARLWDALAVVDEAGRLAPVRAVLEDAVRP
jgi:tetratricopeptide (TPR) repeat protein